MFTRAVVYHSKVKALASDQAFNARISALLLRYLVSRSETDLLTLLEAFTPVLQEFSDYLAPRLDSPEDAFAYLQESFIYVVTRMQELPKDEVIWLCHRLYNYLRAHLRRGKRQQRESTYSDLWAELQEEQATVAAMATAQPREPFPNEVRDDPRNILRQGYEQGVLGPKTVELMVAQSQSGRMAVVSKELGLKLTTAYQRVKEGQKRMVAGRQRRPYALSPEEARRFQAVLQSLATSSGLPVLLPQLPAANDNTVAPQLEDTLEEETSFGW